MRLQRPLYAQKPIEQIRLRIVGRDIPAGAELEVTDVQLQPGEEATGVGVNVREAGTTAGGTHWRNGVVHEGMEVLALANIDRATPVRMEVLNARADTRIGSYRFGTPPAGRAHVDGRTHSASAGWGRPPIITERSDLYLTTIEAEGRAHLRLQWEERQP